MSYIVSISLTLLSASANTAKMTFKRKNEPITISRTQKIIAIHHILESIKLYMIVDQPSRVIIWKIVSMDQPKLSKVVMP